MSSDICDLLSRMADELDHYRQLLSDDRREVHPLATFARAVLAGRGTPATPPAPEPGEVARFTAWLQEHAGQCAELGRPDWAHMAARAATLLQQQAAPAPAVVPVPVSERLPGEGDCDAEGRCWIGTWSDIDGEPTFDWAYTSPRDWTWQGIASIQFWLPAHAIPLPQSGEESNV